jgi:hypothetical protein
MKTYFLWMTLVLAMTSCVNPQSKDMDTNEPEKVEEAGIRLETFRALDEIVGCSCLIASDSLTYTKGNYIYGEKYGLTDGTSYGFIYPNGEKVKLNSTEIQVLENQRNVFLEGQGYSVEISLTLKHTIAREVRSQTGVLKVTDPSGQIITMPVYGVCGC